MIILGLDPGNEQSAWCAFNTDERKIAGFGKEPNDALLERLQRMAPVINPMVIEQVASFGMPVGAEVFETVFWSGRFAQAWLQHGGEIGRLKRIEIKMHLCQHPRAKDGNVRQALLDKFGPPGTKKAPGVLYGISGDVWSALAVAVTWAEKGKV